mmetsp:Transcript_11974/g.26613  ORF Transcript_11974/g.26613 Transcript_11974/m.26613 type:complete len:457 (+) Transcript_11974:455-1825(+)
MQAPLRVLRFVLIIGCMRVRGGDDSMQRPRQALHLIADIRCTYVFEFGVPKGAVCAKIVSLTSFLAAADVLGLHVYGAEVLSRAHAGCLELWVCFELAMMLAGASITAVTYMALMIDSARAEYGRERNGTLTLALDLVGCGVRVSIHLLFLSGLAFRVVIPERLPVYIVADLVPLVSHSVSRLRGLQRSASAMVAASTFRTATSHEMARTGTCIVCRDDFAGSPNSNVVRLGCGHVFHRQCLTSWFRVQQVCPTCRHCVLEHEQVETPTLLDNGDESDSDCELSQDSLDDPRVECDVTPSCPSNWTEMDFPIDEFFQTSTDSGNDDLAVTPAPATELAVSDSTQQVDSDGFPAPADQRVSEETGASPGSLTGSSPLNASTRPQEPDANGVTPCPIGDLSTEEANARKLQGCYGTQWGNHAAGASLGGLLSQMQDALAMADWMTECAKLHGMRQSPA